MAVIAPLTDYSSIYMHTWLCKEESGHSVPLRCSIRDADHSYLETTYEIIKETFLCYFISTIC